MFAFVFTHMFVGDCIVFANVMANGGKKKETEPFVAPFMIFFSIGARVCLPAYPSVCLSVCSSVPPYVCPSVRLFVCLSVRLFVRPFVRPSLCLSFHLPACKRASESVVFLSVCVSVCLTACSVFCLSGRSAAYSTSEHTAARVSGASMLHCSKLCVW